MEAASTSHYHTFSAIPPGLTRSELKNGQGSVPKKKPSRRRPNTGRRFQCNHDGCGKTYSRAEHLQRHQLNHSPKGLFSCDYAGCDLTFVRKDLRDRHRKRHRHPSPSGSFGQPTVQETPSKLSTGGSDNERTPGAVGLRTLSSDSGRRPSLTAATSSVSFPARSTAGFDGFNANPYSGANPLNSSNGELGFPNLERKTSITPGETINHHATSSVGRPSMRFSHSHGSIPAVNPGPKQLSPQSECDSHRPGVLAGFKLSESMSMTADSSQKAMDLTQTRSSKFGPSQQQNYIQGVGTPGQGTGQQQRSSTATAASTFNAPFVTPDLAMSYETPIIDDPSLGISPSGRTDEFTSWLFDQNGGASHPSHASSNIYHYQPNVFGQIYSDEMPSTLFDQFADVPDEPDPMTSTDFLLPAKEPGLSDWKRRHLVSIIQGRFFASGNSGLATKQQIFGGNDDDAGHLLNMNSFQIYLASYWTRFHDQFPLLHRATFIPDQIHDCLLLTVIVVGASLLDDTQHGSTFCDAAARLASVVAWSLRWQILTDADSGPPAKLWVLQSLAILEFYEKMNATRALHERAHVHFAATLTLMRRGSALIGDHSIPPSRDEVATQVDDNDAFASDKWWNHWVAQEATRRAAFGAFFLDALHATMFGHAATMVIHEIHLPLPCDDTLWSAGTASEVGRIEFSLYTNGIKPTMFLTGVKRTLSCQKVRTNPFGRIILMAGLLSIAWHMHQKELYRSTLEERSVGMPEGWKAQLLKAFDWWKQDFDDSFSHMRKSGIDAGKTGFSQERALTSQHLATGLYHMGHIAIQVDMPDLCILAGAKVLLGRVITKSDYERVHLKLKQWVSTASARHAVHYSIQYLKLTLLDPESGQLSDSGRRSSSQVWDAAFRGGPNSPDIVLIRPWTMYYSALVLWTYGYLLDGPLRPFPESSAKPRALDSDIAQQTPEQIQQMEHDAKTYLHAMGRFTHPNGLQNVTNSRNKVVGLMGVVLTALESSRWELLHEARQRLHSCVDQLR
ncbi:uncharacterized protein HMPREF1541_01987 [Cyphellophora europaea CBS 101466]|uniref:C2H2-type domain-containing protein n=1 Tax=Cyphellophora europaea (strain CBS 101466) TaxID=1220924 RepID=W2S4D7_CYPE1|nr:uncharacterized protein HMPREF1541_01987 [Cyphellophora europaea CBS 101466]ETN42829.1 hypothetical protein HMPREF1541_01987 [Cyphellophora europaea CBS 101466]